MAGPYTVHNSAGELIAGDVVLDQAMKQAADQAGGWIEDFEGSVVYGTKADG